VARLPRAESVFFFGRHADRVQTLADLRGRWPTSEALSARCRQQSSSCLADMGQEMPYRYQEHLMSELLDALRGFLARVDEPDGDAASGPTRVGVAARRT
jgi:hypothetical protein